jgi:CDP-glycerol glycerophosphotransferase (TagB/SpsB family)
MEQVLGRLPERLRREIYQSFSLLIMAIFFVLRLKKNNNIKKRITFVDFRYSGNLRSFYQFVQENKIDVEIGFMPADPIDYNDLKKSLPKDIKLLSRLSFKDVLWAFQSDIFLTSIMMRRFLSITKMFAPHIKFVQVFHTMNLLGEPPSWFEAMSKYDMVFCSSDWVVKTFEKLTGKEGQFIPTGFAVVDDLFSPKKSRDEIIVSFGLDPKKKTILLSPTLSAAIDWSSSYSLYPYSKEFLDKLDKWATSKEAQIIFRNHPHEYFDKALFNGLKSIKLLDSKTFKSVSDQLIAADIMITDLSGIGGYYIALQKPIVFLETSPVLQNDDMIYFLNPNELPGPRVKTTDELFLSIEHILNDDTEKRGCEAAFTRLYGKTFDGNAAKRYFENLYDKPSIS